MDNRDISKVLSETARLMELYEENGFKVKSLQNAAFQIGRLDVALDALQADELEQLKGIGKSTGKRVLEIIKTGTLSELNRLLEITPPGILELMRIKGIGPKKTAILWKQLQVESPGELLYACNENRLIELKGFGSKTQEQIKKAIEFTQNNRGLFHYAALEEQSMQLVKQIEMLPGVDKVSLTGEIRRKCEVLSSIDILIATETIEPVKNAITSSGQFSEYSFSNENDLLIAENNPGVRINLFFSTAKNFATKLFLTTGSSLHFEESGIAPGELANEMFADEEAVYTHFNLPYIEPETREGMGEVFLARKNKFPELIQYHDLKGCLHNHSTYSDGLNSLSEMALHCREMGYEYFGICDHSKSAFYANGMQPERVHLQHQEIDRLNSEMAPFRIFKGIESDILQDGLLDYDTNTLATFDFVVASIHSNLKMDVTKATNRLLRAIENPFTTILGHPTGRLLLAREGYPVHHKEIIDACSLNGVIIELNAHPFRLDLDWRWIRYAVEKGVMISINPDAHALAGIHDMYYGVCVARKGLLSRENTLNTKSVGEITALFEQKKNKALQVLNPLENN